VPNGETGGRAPNRLAAPSVAAKIGPVSKRIDRRARRDFLSLDSSLAHAPLLCRESSFSLALRS
jgi:hypothetical protein